MKLRSLIAIAAMTFASWAMTTAIAGAEPASCAAERAGLCRRPPSSAAPAKPPLMLAQNKFCTVSDDLARREAQILNSLLTGADCRFLVELKEGYAMNPEKRCGMQTMMKFFSELNPKDVILASRVPDDRPGLIVGNFPPDSPDPLIKGWSIDATDWLKAGCSL